MTTETFTGKRSIKRSVAGNINGYVGRKFYRNLGLSYSRYDEEFAERWVKGEVELDAQY